MADQITSDKPARAGGEMLWHLLAAYWFPFLLTMALMVGCYAAAGATLGLFLGGLVVATLVTPGAVLAEEAALRRAVAWAGIADAVLLAWLGPVVSGVISVADWGEAALVLVAYAAAVAGLGVALRWARIHAVLAAATTVFLGLAWLTWPVWMAPWLTGANRETVVAWLVWGHPVFALDRAMLDAFGVPWAQMPIAYRLTNIGDDIGYEVPRSVWACVVLHIAVAGLLVLTRVGWPSRLNKRSAETDPTG